MALRPLLLSAVVGIAALGAFHTPVAEAGGSFSVSIGTSPHYRSGYGSGYGGHYDGRYGGRYDSRYSGRDYRHYNRGGYRTQYAFVPGHWAYGHYGRVWVPDQYVPIPRHDRRYDHGYGYGHDRQVIQRSSAHPRPLPGGFYDQRGG